MWLDDVGHPVVRCVPFVTTIDTFYLFVYIIKFHYI